MLAKIEKGLDLELKEFCTRMYLLIWWWGWKEGGGIFFSNSKSEISMI